MMRTNRQGLPKWLNFEADKLILCGTVPESEIFKKYQFVITASDGLQHESQELQMRIYPSLYQILKLLLQIASNALCLHPSVACPLYLAICASGHLHIWPSAHLNRASSRAHREH